MKTSKLDIFSYIFSLFLRFLLAVTKFVPNFAPEMLKALKRVANEMRIAIVRFFMVRDVSGGKQKMKGWTPFLSQESDVDSHNPLWFINKMFNPIFRRHEW